MNKKGIAIIAAASGLAAAAVAGAVVIDRSFKEILGSDAKWEYGNGSAEVKKSKKAVPSQRAELQAAGEKWLMEYPYQHAWIDSSKDGTRLHAAYYPCENAKRIVLLSHGYRASVFSFAGIVEWLNSQGCELLAIDQRGTGKSGGKWITYGALEKHDVRDWLDWIHKHNQGKLPVYLFGISMGAATVLMTTEYELPDDVKGIISDCGYTSMRDVVHEYVDRWYKLPTDVVIAAADKIMKSKIGVSMDEADAERAVRNCKLPIIFIHGTADDFVYPYHTLINERACASPDKKVLWIEGAEHAKSWYQDPVTYHKALSEFFAKCDR